MCVVVLLATFLYTKKNNAAIEEKQNNIAVKGGVVDGLTGVDQYQQNILDSITKQQLESFESVTDSFKKKDTDTLSDKIAKDVFSQYVEYNTSGSLDPDTVKQMTLNNLSGQEAYTPKVYVQNLKLLSPTIGNLKNYANRIAYIQIELDKTIASISNKPNPDEYIKNLYIATSNLYYRQGVPSSIAQYHANIINAYREYVTAFNLLQLQQKDPARALLGVEQAKKAGETIVKNINDIRNVVVLNKITYEPKDAAYQWINPPGNSTITKADDK